MHDELPHDYPAGCRERLNELFHDDPYAQGLGIRLDAWGPGWAEVSCSVGRAHANFIGTPHGGALFSIADCALGFASNSHGRQCFAISVQVQFLAGPHEGELLTAKATERHRGRSVASYDIVLAGQGGRLIGSLQGLVHRSRGWHLAEDAWPAAWRDDH